MDKKDVLEKAQKESKYGDEMYNYLCRRGSQIAMTVGLCMCLIGVIVDLILHASFTLLGYFMMITQLTMETVLYGFLAMKYKRRGDIICAVLYSVGLILFLICLVIHLVGLM